MPTVSVLPTNSTSVSRLPSLTRRLDTSISLPSALQFPRSSIPPYFHLLSLLPSPLGTGVDAPAHTVIPPLSICFLLLKLNAFGGIFGDALLSAGAEFDGAGGWGEVDGGVGGWVVEVWVVEL